ncbi:MAG TPA: TonB-dependent receptor plug domain-containing protein, partial [Candidatus Methylomirabilis sp.]
MSRTVFRISGAFVVTMFMVVGCLVVLLLGRIASAQDSPPQEPELALEPVVVSAARLADAIQELRRIPGQVYTVTADEIERTKARSVQDALRLAVPGIVFYDQVGNRFQQTVDLRGFNGQPNPSVSVFVDGVRVNDPDSNAVNFDLISIQDIERIEVLPGATAVYGRNAMGGVINIITKRGGKAPQTTVEGALGSFSQYRVKVNTSGPIKDLDYYASVVWDRESGFRDFSDGRVTNFTGRLGYRPTDKTDLSLGY